MTWNRVCSRSSEPRFIPPGGSALSVSSRTGRFADIAVIEIAEDTPDIPEAGIELNRVEPGAQVVKVGWGCEETTNVDPTTLELGRYKTDDAAVIATSEIQHHNSPITDDQVAVIDGSYVVTAGHDQDEDNARPLLGRLRWLPLPPQQWRPAHRRCQFRLYVQTRPARAWGRFLDRLAHSDLARLVTTSDSG